MIDYQKIHNLCENSSRISQSLVDEFLLYYAGENERLEEKIFGQFSRFPIYMLSLKRWHTFPHFAKYFYHSKKNLFIATAMTQRGYDSLIAALNKQGSDYPASPEITATPAMLHIVKQILNVDVEMTPYEKHFVNLYSTIILKYAVPKRV
jgi:hypothetical protein